jgi:hypothetical protein
MKIKLLIISIVLSLLSTSAIAATFGTDPGTAALETKLNSLTLSPNPGDTSIDVYNGEVPDAYDSYWDNTGSGMVSTFLFELANYAPTNTFGIYDPDYPYTNTLQIFSGTDTDGAVRTVYVGSGGEIWLDTYYVGKTPDMTIAGGPVYGFYLDATAGTNGGFWYSDTGLNTDNMDHMYAYQGQGDQMDLPDPWDDDTVIDDTYYILCWEDLKKADGSGTPISDRDYTDMAILVESIRPIPVPAAVILGILGMGVASLKLRKYA